MGVLEFERNPDKETVEEFIERVTSTLYPKGAKHCMMHCKFATGYWDGSGAFCNNSESEYYSERVRSWDIVGDCAFFQEGERVIPHEEEPKEED